MSNKKVSELVSKIPFQKLTTNERKIVVKERVYNVVRKFKKAYKTEPKKLTLSPELEVHLKDSLGMTLDKKDYTITGFYVMVAELETDTITEDRIGAWDFENN